MAQRLKHRQSDSVRRDVHGKVADRGCWLLKIIKSHAAKDFDRVRDRRQTLAWDEKFQLRYRPYIMDLPVNLHGNCATVTDRASIENRRCRRLPVVLRSSSQRYLQSADAVFKFSDDVSCHHSGHTL